MLKTLIALACVAVIAAVSYYFWSEYQADQQRRGVAAFRAARDGCLADLHRWNGNRSSADLRGIVEDCIVRGLVTKSDIDGLTFGR